MLASSSSRALEPPGVGIKTPFGKSVGINEATPYVRDPSLFMIGSKYEDNSFLRSCPTLAKSFNLDKGDLIIRSDPGVD